MGEFVRRNPILAALAAVAFLLAVALVLEYVVARPGGPAGPARPVVAADAKLLPPPPPVVAEQAYPETSARPLFTPTRRLAPEAIAAQQPSFQRGQFVLLGVTIAGDTRIAMLREKASGKIHRIARGAEVNGIKVAAIEPESVTLAMSAEQESLPLTVQRPGAPGQPASPGGPAMQAAPPASATLLGPFGTSPGTTAHMANAPAGVTPGAPPPGFGAPASPGGFPVPNNAALPAQGPIPSQGAVPTPPLTSAVPQGTDPNAGLSPEEILARRRARRAQQTQ